MIGTGSETEAIESVGQEQQKDDLFDESLKRRPRAFKRGVNGLTCSEAQVDAILSEGETT